MDDLDFMDPSANYKPIDSGKLIFNLNSSVTDMADHHKRKRSVCDESRIATMDSVPGKLGAAVENVRGQEATPNSFEDALLNSNARIDEEDKTADGAENQPAQRRKRQFTNRTKTGCITCRRRKKKCDEGKPECSNCKRGGFHCEGYTNKVDWSGKARKAIRISGDIKYFDPSRVESEIVPKGFGAPNPIRSTQSLETASRAENDESFSRNPEHSAPNLDHNTTVEVKERTEKDKMLLQQLYYPFAADLLAERELCKAACWRFNNAATNPNLGISKVEQGRLLLEVLRPGRNWEPAPAVPGGYMADGYSSDLVDVTIEAPFNCSYGYNIRIGKGVHIHMGCTIQDANLVTIKDGAVLSPTVSILCAIYPMDPRRRKDAKGKEIAKPVTVKEDCWLGGNVVVLGGVTIGQGAVVGAGSVVTMDIPPFTLAAGNPAGIVRGLYTNGVDL